MLGLTLVLFTLLALLLGVIGLVSLIVSAFLSSKSTAKRVALTGLGFIVAGTLSFLTPSIIFILN